MVGRTSGDESLGTDFTRFWFASAASNLGDGIRFGALPLLALSLTDDARLIALVTASTLVPWVVFGPVGGALVDRLDRRRLMIGGQLGRAVVGAVLAVLVATDQASIWWVVALAFGLGLGEVVVDASSQAAIPQLVTTDQLDRANGRLITAITVLDNVVGVALGAVLFGIAAGLPFAVDVATFAISASLLATIRRPLQTERTSTSSIRTDIGEGMRFLLGHPLLRGLAGGVATANLAANTAFAVVVILVVDELGAGEVAFGVVLSVGAIGGVVGALVAARATARWGRRRVLTGAPLLLAGSFVITAAAVAPWMASVAFFASSFSIVVFNVPAQSVRQAVTPEHLLGRVVTSFRIFGMSAAPLGAILGGFVTEATDVRTANVVAAVIGAGAWVLLARALRHLEAD